MFKKTDIFAMEYYTKLLHLSYGFGVYRILNFWPVTELTFEPNFSHLC